MLHLHRTLLAAPIFLSLACNVTVGNSASDSVTEGNTTSTSDPATTNPTNPSTPSTDPTSTTENPPTTGTTGDPTTGATTSTTDPATTTGPTTGDTAGVGETCVMSGDCAGGLSCYAPYGGAVPAEDDFTCHADCVADAGSGNSEEVWCGDDDSCCTADFVCDPMGYCLPGAEDTTGDTESSSTGDTEGGTTIDIDTVGTTIDTGSTGDTDTGGGLQPLILLSSFEVFGDCMPVVPDDPISATWIATFDNKLGMADYNASVKTATLTYSPGIMEFVQGINVAPAMSGVVGVGKTVMKAQSKTKALMNLPMDCSQCGKPVHLDVVFTVDGQDITASADAVMTCAL